MRLSHLIETRVAYCGMGVLGTARPGLLAVLALRRAVRSLGTASACRAGEAQLSGYIYYPGRCT